MNPALLRRVGALMYGDNWKTDLARDLNCSPRTLRRWANNGNEMPSNLPNRLLNLVRRRNAALVGLIRELQEIVQN